MRCHIIINILMKLINLVFIFGLMAIASALPWEQQIALANALQVGRDSDPQTWDCADCNENNKPLSSVVIEEKGKDVKSILSVYNQYTVLAFRYTATAKNIFQDLLWAFQEQDQHACKGCKVQKQFDRMWNSIKNDVLQGLKQRAHTNRLIITGISLGGGLSCLSFVDINQAKIFDSIEIITFGAPRVGNKQWAEWFDKQTNSTRIFIADDPIPALPRCLTLVCNYKQTGTPIVCNLNSQTCHVKGNKQAVETYSGSYADYMNNLAEAINQHYSEDDNVDGIIDHVTGYKKLIDFTLIE